MADIDDIRGDVKVIEQRLTRLVKSDSTATRNTARRNLKRILRKVWEDYDISFPQMRKDGTPVHRKEIKGGYCPICSTPMRTISTLLAHLATKHRGTIASVFDLNRRQRYLCACGKNASRRGMLQHLHRAGNLKDHFAVAALAMSAKAPSKP